MSLWYTVTPPIGAATAICTSWFCFATSAWKSANRTEPSNPLLSSDKALRCEIKSQKQQIFRMAIEKTSKRNEREESLIKSADPLRREPLNHYKNRKHCKHKLLRLLITCTTFVSQFLLYDLNSTLEPLAVERGAVQEGPPFLLHRVRTYPWWFTQAQDDAQLFDRPVRIVVSQRKPTKTMNINEHKDKLMKQQ